MDLLWLAEQGFEVVGVEFVEQAITDFFAELQQTPKAFSLGGRPAFQARGTTLVAADFYEFSGEAAGQFDAIYDRAALVAISPHQRRQSALQLAKLAKKGAPLLLMSFLHDLERGPRHSIPEAELAALLGQSFGIHKMFKQDILEQSPRFAARGATFMKEQVWVGKVL